MLHKINAMLQAAATGQARFPPTEIYNENWMLRLVVDWLETKAPITQPIPMTEGATWYSEPLLATAFRARHRGDPFAESHTRADAALGHFEIGGSGKGDLVLSPKATQLSVIEGKMFSPLSRGVKNAPGFDQAARNVACMAEVLRRSGRPPSALSHLSFHVIAPRRQIDSGEFGALVTKDSIEKKVRGRVDSYQGRLRPWRVEWFDPTLERATVELVSWEDILDQIFDRSPEAGTALYQFYDRCIGYNGRVRGDAQG